MLKFTSKVEENRIDEADRMIYDFGGWATELTAKHIKSVARALVHVKSGRLRDAIDYEMNKHVAYVGIQPGPAASYWHFVEYGTVHAPPHPFMRPAAEAGKSTFVNIMMGLGGRLENV